MAEFNDYVRLSKHVLLRGALVGSTLGIVAGTGVSVAKKRPIANVVPSFAWTGLIVGGGAATVMLISRLASMEDVSTGVLDRSFRLLHNHGQTHVDKFATAGFAVGAGYGAYSSTHNNSSKTIALRALRMGAVGMVSGCVASVLIRTVKRKLSSS